MAKLYFIYAAMNAGKSALLLQSAYNYRERGMQVMLWTSSHHGTEADEAAQIASRIGLTAAASIYRNDTDLAGAIAARLDEGPLDAVFVDEAQFLSRDQVWQLSDIVDRRGVPVMCYGLRTDFQGHLFDGSAELLAIADQLREMKTICHCGRKATMTARIDASGRAVTEGAQVEIDKSHYEAFCREHWKTATKLQG